jgi:hypothetical protein
MSYRFLSCFIMLGFVASVAVAATPKAKGPSAASAQGAACVTGGLAMALVGSASTALKEEDEPLKKGASKSKAVAPPALTPDLVAFNAAEAALPDGVKPYSDIPIGNQCDEEICWAWEEKNFVEGESQRQGGSKEMVSADHNAFWHLYAQFFNHKEYFNQLRKKVEANEISKVNAIKEVRQVFTLHKGSTTRQNKGYVVSPGSNESTALLEANEVGFVPAAEFDHVIKTPEVATAFQNALNELIGEFLSDKSKLSTYTKTADDGINDDLYTLMVARLKPYYGGSTAHPPYRPNDTFKVGGKIYTPKTFMTEALKFNPNDYIEVTMTKENQELLLQAVNEVLMDPHNPKAVPIGFAIYDQQLAEEQGGFFDNTLTPPEPIGGHEVMLANQMVVAKGSPGAGTSVGKVAINTWGTGTGIDIEGKATKVKSKTGFYGFSDSYFFSTTARGEPPSFLLTKAFLASNPKYASLLHSK